MAFRGTPIFPEHSAKCVAPIRLADKVLQFAGVIASQNCQSVKF